MLNLLGDLWRAPQFREKLVRQKRAYWHFYGKSGSEGLRKCGHVNFLGEQGLAQALEFRSDLLSGE
jgi:phosphoribosylaminoimidazole carboxylase (NCAIR synthetase)